MLIRRAGGSHQVRSLIAAEFLKKETRGNGIHCLEFIRELRIFAVTVPATPLHMRTLAGLFIFIDLCCLIRRH